MRKSDSHATWCAGVLLVLLTSVGNAAPTLADVQQQWDRTNFSLNGDAQIDAFERLIETVDAYTAAHPREAEAWVWSGIVRSSFAGARGGLGALGLAKQARKDFERALEIDADALHGSAYTSLGTLYFSVPGWPVGFGNDDKAENLLLQGLKLDPDGLDSHFFYAEFLRDQGRDVEARQHYRTAMQAPLRPGREIADAGRRRQIEAILADMAS
jgi:tetratricopeptide (TPR) repeat protein